MFIPRSSEHLQLLRLPHLEAVLLDDLERVLVVLLEPKRQVLDRHRLLRHAPEQLLRQREVAAVVAEEVDEPVAVGELEERVEVLLRLALPLLDVAFKLARVGEEQQVQHLRRCRGRRANLLS